MRFRRLTEEEIAPLEEDFVQFLASNHITAKDWENLKAKDAARVHELLDIFSDIVFEKVFNTMEYLQHRTKDVIRVFHCQEKHITMTGLQITDSTKDLTNPEDLAILSDPNSIEGAIKIFQMEKAYAEERADEVFKMMYKDGCQPAPKGMFDLLVQMYEQTTSK